MYNRQCQLFTMAGNPRASRSVAETLPRCSATDWHTRVTAYVWYLQHNTNTLHKRWILQSTCTCALVQNIFTSCCPPAFHRSHFTLSARSLRKDAAGCWGLGVRSDLWKWLRCKGTSHVLHFDVLALLVCDHIFIYLFDIFLFFKFEHSPDISAAVPKAGNQWDSHWEGKSRCWVKTATGEKEWSPDREHQCYCAKRQWWIIGSLPVRWVVKEAAGALDGG